MSQSFTRRLLFPLIPLYRLALAFRELQLLLEPTQRLRFPVVSIGNLSTGGSGKTPFVIALARALKRRGLRVDVLSRGYGRQSEWIERVDEEGTAEEFGDEPLLIARVTGVPVYVAAERYDAGLLAEAEAEAKAEAEAEQLALEPKPYATEWVKPEDTPKDREKESEAPEPTAQTETNLATVNPELPGESLSTSAEPEKSAMDSTPEAPLAEQSPAEASSAAMEPDNIPPPLSVHLLDDGFQHRQLARDVNILLLNQRDWKDWLLPAGNLREPLEAIYRASVIAIPANEPELEVALNLAGWDKPIWRLRRTMEIPAVNGPVAAFSGIARPEQFFEGLEDAGLEVVLQLAFPDHYTYTISLLEELIAAAYEKQATAIITTEKDLVRLEILHRYSRNPCRL